MKKTLIAITIFLSSCTAQEPVSTEKSNNPNLPVAHLFDIDGCRVYRFRDNGRYVYFTNCDGSTQSFNQESTGKTSTLVPVTVTTRLLSKDIGK